MSEAIPHNHGLFDKVRDVISPNRNAHREHSKERASGQGAEGVLFAFAY